jgi:hypothetical protein
MTTECEAAPSVAYPTDLPAVNHAVALCMESWTRAYQSVMQSNRGRCEAAAEAAAAYRRTLPTLVELDGIRNFIACVAHGIAIGAIEGSSASHLLYAAQVARGVHNFSSQQKKLPG